MTAVSATIGASGDYTTYAALVADIANVVLTGDDLTIELIDAADYTEAFDLTSISGSVVVSSIHLTSGSAVRHDGTAGSGPVIAPSSSGDIVIKIPNNCDTEISWLEISPTAEFNHLIENVADSANTRTINVHNNIIHGASFATAATWFPINIDECGTWDLHNNLIYDLTTTGGAMQVVTVANDSGWTPRVQNNTIDRITNNSSSGYIVGIRWQTSTANGVLANNYVGTLAGTSSGAKNHYFHDATPATRTHNASAGTTAAGTSAINSAAASDQYADPANGDYTIKDGSAAILNTGTARTLPSGITIDVFENTRSAQWSIGASNNTAIVSNTITITTPVERTVYKRTGNSASVTIAGNYTGSPTNIEYRWKGGSWATLDSSPSGGTFSAAVSLAEGSGNLEVRFSNDTGVTDSHVFGVGEVFVIAGQSNASGRLDNHQTYSGSLNSSVFDEDDTTPRVLADPTDTESSSGTVWPLVATLIETDQSVPVMFITTALGGSNASSWNPTGGANFTAMLARIAAAPINGVSAILFDQGEADANSATEAAFQQYLEDFAADAQADSRYTFKTLVALTGYSTPLNDGLNQLRQAQIASWGNSNIEPGINSINRAGLHWETNAEAAIQADLWFKCIDDALFDGTDGRGPVLQTATHSGSTTAILTFNKDLNDPGANYASAAWSFDNDDGTARTISSVARTGTREVTVTLSGNIDGTNPTISMGLLNTAAGVSIPESTASVPAEPIYNFAVTTPDVTAPTLSSAQVPAAGTTLILTMSEDIQPASGVTGFTVTSNGQSVSVSSAARTADSQITLTLGGTIYQGATVLLSYSPGNVQDLSSNNLAAFSDSAVTNNSTQTVSATMTDLIAVLARKDVANFTAEMNQAITDINANGGAYSPETDSLEAIADGSLSGNITVSGFTQSALAALVNTDSGEITAVSGSVAKLAQADTSGITSGVIAGLNNTIVHSAPVATDGQITSPLIIGDDYKAANGRALTWTTSAITGATSSGSTCKLGFSHPSKGSFVVNGSISVNSDGDWVLSFEIENTDSAALEPGEFDWSVEVIDDASNGITRVRNSSDCTKVEWVNRQT